MSGSSFAQKALARAAGLDRAAVGEIVDARPRVALSHDNTAAIHRLWRQLGQARVAIPERIVVTLDHAAPPPTARHAENHAEIRRFVDEQGIRFFDVGRGICHQVLAEEALTLPGDLVLGADSHTPHFGWLGAFGCGIGRTEMAAVWATGELWLRVPESLRVEIVGRPAPWVSAKDLALRLLRELGADGALYRSVEFSGDALPHLGLEGRMVLANMSAEMGAKTAYVAPDEEVFALLARILRRRLRREGAAAPEEAELRETIQRHALFPDPDAEYAAGHRLDAERVVPQVTGPHAVDRSRDVTELAGVRVDQAFLGTCTNGRIGDLEIAARILGGRRVARRTRFVVVPASSEVLAEATRRGILETLIEAGAAIGTPGCGPCMGNHLGLMAAGEVCLSSGNRNFPGRMGSREAEIYLASPAVVAASAVAGRIVPPSEVVER